MSTADHTPEFKGLTTAQAAESRARHGANVLTPPPRKSLFALFLAKFRDPLIQILILACVVSVGISFYEYFSLGKSAEVFFEPVGIIMAIFLATGLAFVFEYKAEKEFAVLNRINDDEPVQVLRDGTVREIPRRDVVVGDVIHLSAGQEVPADARLLESVRLSVDESTLTGEPICAKTTDPAHFDPEATFPSDMVLRGTKIMEGHAVAIVTAVGDATEAGKVYEASTIDSSTKTPLNEQLDRLGHLVAVASYVIGALVIAGRVLMYLINAGWTVTDWIDFLAYLLQSVMMAVTLIVVAVPEGLPMAVTLSLAYSMRRMLRTGNLVRKLHACETMGAVTTICTDKTGTLTANRMTVEEVTILGSDGRISDDKERRMALMTAMAINSTAELDLSDSSRPVPVGNPTEGALIMWINASGGDYRTLRQTSVKEEELPFSTELKYMASVVRTPGGSKMLYVKGAPEIVYSLCHPGEDMPSDLRALLEGYQNRGMRTLAFASRPLKEDEKPIADGRVSVSGMTFDGIAAISDPVREDVPDAVRQCLHAGIKVKIVTGDTPATAREIGRQIGLWTSADDSTAEATGPEIAAMTDEELRSRVQHIKIISRARPLDKKRLVEALQSHGEVVAVTGDGTNDAPALKAAQVGLSMGDGTSVAKEASDITILNNSFSGITNAVVWGRSLYRNIQRFILFQLTVNVAACLTVLVGSFMGTDAPLTVTQMLWVNLVMDTFAAMALASLPPSRKVLDDKPRPRRAFIITPAMTRFIVSVGLLFGAAMIGLLYIFEHSHIDSMTDLWHSTISRAYAGLSPTELSLFFTIFVMLQFWNLFNARAFASGRSALFLRHCGEFLIIAAVVFVGQILIVTVGGAFFNVVPLSFSDWLWIVGLTSPVFLVGEALRAMHKNS